MTTTATLGQRALVLAIDGYRRWLSGRGPLRRVRCTFHHGETCSAYGRRIALEAPGVLWAVAAIRRRLHRCADAALYVLPDEVLGWGPAYDRPLPTWRAELERDRELPATKDSLLRARAAVARWRGDRRELVALAALEPPAAGPRLIVRRTDTRVRTAVATSVRPTGVALALLALATAFILTSQALALTVLALTALTLTGRVGHAVGRRRRLRWQTTAAAIARADRGAAPLAAAS